MAFLAVSSYKEIDYKSVAVVDVVLLYSGRVAAPETPPQA